MVRMQNPLKGLMREVVRLRQMVVRTIWCVTKPLIGGAHSPFGKAQTGFVTAIHVSAIEHVLQQALHRDTSGARTQFSTIGTTGSIHHPTHHLDDATALPHAFWTSAMACSLASVLSLILLSFACRATLLTHLRRFSAAIDLQRICRGVWAQRSLAARRQAATRLQSSWRMLSKYLGFVCLRAAAMRIQLASRRRAAVRSYAAIRLQAAERRRAASQHFHEKRSAAVLLAAVSRAIRTRSIVAVILDLLSFVRGEHTSQPISQRRRAMCRLQTICFQMFSVTEAAAALMLTRVARGLLARLEAAVKREAINKLLERDGSFARAVCKAGDDDPRTHATIRRPLAQLTTPLSGQRRLEWDDACNTHDSRRGCDDDDLSSIAGSIAGLSENDYAHSATFKSTFHAANPLVTPAEKQAIYDRRLLELELKLQRLATAQPQTPAKCGISTRTGSPTRLLESDTKDSGSMSPSPQKSSRSSLRARAVSIKENLYGELRTRFGKGSFTPMRTVSFVSSSQC